jgi:hypothetical protein
MSLVEKAKRAEAKKAAMPMKTPKEKDTKRIRGSINESGTKDGKKKERIDNIAREMVI